MIAQKSVLYDQLKKPFSGSGNLNILVKKYYTDVDGAVIAIGAAPAALRKSIPVFLLGNFDRIGAYAIGEKTLNVDPSVLYLMTYVHGVNQPFLWNSGFNTVQNNFATGDLITVYTDSFDAPTGFVFIQQTVSYGSLSSILDNTSSNPNMVIDKVAVQVDNELQLNEGWQIVRFDSLGTFNQEPFNVIQFRPPFFKLTDFIELVLSFKFTPFVGINFLFQTTSNAMQINFKITK